MKRKVRFDDETYISYAEFGSPTGYPILVQHGLIASINDTGLFDRLIELGTHVICIARPGYGESSPYPLRSMAEWGDLVSTVVDELQLSEFDVFGISSGAPYSYSIGNKSPDKVRHVYILSGIPALYDPSIRAHWPYELKSDASISEMQHLAYRLFFKNMTKAELSNDNAKDSMMNDCYGVAQDLRLRSMDWGFNLTDIAAKVYMRHSRVDQAVPFITAEMTARLLPNCEFEARELDLHFSEQVLDDFIQTVMADNYL